jgi:hypothetical protein
MDAVWLHNGVALPSGLYSAGNVGLTGLNFLVHREC